MNDHRPDLARRGAQLPRTAALVAAVVVLVGLVAGCGDDAPVLNAVGKYSDVAVITDVDVFNPVAFALEQHLEADARTGIRREPLLEVDIFDWDKRREAARYKNVIVLGYVKGKDQGSREIQRQLGGEQMTVLGTRNLFMAVREDVYANNQNVVFLAGVDRNFMQAAIAEEAPALRGQIEERNRERVRDYLFAQGHDTEAEERLREQAGFRLQVPSVYELNSIKTSSDGKLGCAEVVAVQPTRSVVVFWQEVDPEQVDLTDTDALLELRRRWAVFLEEGLQDLFGYEWSAEVFRGQEWPMLTGLYEIPDANLGGPFRTIFVLDAGSRRLYGINTLCFNPNQDKVTWLREARAVADTFVPRP